MNKNIHKAVADLREVMKTVNVPASKKEARVFHEFLKHPAKQELYGYEIWMDLCLLFNEVEDKVKNPKKRKKAATKLKMYNYTPGRLQSPA